MNKTNVSILQEMMVKKGTVPNWELIYDGGGTHINTFTYRVSCDGFVANGTGRCKKDAKHTAAKNMLEIIANARKLPELPATPADSPVRTPLPEPLPSSPKTSPNEPFLNAIGELKDLCAENELQEPTYIMISDVGPPHARVFTYQCEVSTFREEGRATTKKQAKHEASRKMLERLTEVVKDLNGNDSIYSSIKKPETRPVNLASAETAMSRFSEVTKAPTKKVNLGVKVTDYHTKLKTFYTKDSVPTRDEVINALDVVTDAFEDTDDSNFDDCTKLELVKELFVEHLVPLNIEISSVVFDGIRETEKIALVKMNTTPGITEVEMGDDEALIELKASKRVIETLKMLMN